MSTEREETWGHRAPCRDSSRQQRARPPLCITLCSAAWGKREEFGERDFETGLLGAHKCPVSSSSMLLVRSSSNRERCNKSTGHLRVDQQVSHGQSSCPDCALGHREPFCPSGLCSLQAERNAKAVDFCPFTESAFTQQHKPELTKKS